MLHFKDVCNTKVRYSLNTNHAGKVGISTILVMVGITTLAAYKLITSEFWHLELLHHRSYSTCELLTSFYVLKKLCRRF